MGTTLIVFDLDAVPACLSLTPLPLAEV